MYKLYICGAVVARSRSRRKLVEMVEKALGPGWRDDSQVYIV